MRFPSEAAVLTLPNTCLFPQAMLPLYIFEPRYRRMLSDSLRGERMFAVALRKPYCQRDIPEKVAGLGLIRASVSHKNGTSHLILQGLTRVRLGKTLRLKPYRVQAIEAILPKPGSTPEISGLSHRLLELVGQRLDQGVAIVAMPAEVDQSQPPPKSSVSGDLIRESMQGLLKLDDPEQLIDLVSCTLLTNAMERQTILETMDLALRLSRLMEFLQGEIERHDT